MILRCVDGSSLPRAFRILAAFSSLMPGNLAPMVKTSNEILLFEVAPFIYPY
jgi:hypothetical protein